MKKIKVKIKDDTFNGLICESNEDTETGMMYKKFNDNFNVMVFPLRENYASFWTKNCIIPLDILFVDDNRINKIHHGCEPCVDDINNCKRYYGVGKFVVELQGGTCNKYLIKEGDNINLVV